MLKILQFIEQHLRSDSRNDNSAKQMLAAFVIVAISTGIRATLPFPILPYLLFLPGIMASGLFFGTISGLSSVVFATLSAVYFFLPPDNGFQIQDFAQGLSVALFALITSGIAIVCSTLRSTLLGLERRITTEVERRTQAESALRQSQKMEAVGQLTGGLAHDFNNLLTGITGSLDLLGSRLKRGKIDGCERYIETAKASAERAAALTHRLLAFSRRQTLEPKVIDVCGLILGIEDMLRRSLGPSINLDVACDDAVWHTLVDPSQLENSVLNLALNARDAMPQGGTIRITVSNRVLDQSAGADRGLDAGEYVSVRVHDTGTGMTPELIERVFEPFFTTKPLGLGTGLGLSMVYGFAKQSGGSVKIHSTVGTGTRVCLLLPRHAGEPHAPIITKDTVPREAGGETILVVDDEPMLVMIMEETLSELGYRTVTASNGTEALAILQSETSIDMLITDVGMPGLNGRQVADGARAVRPSLPVLFVTGYSAQSLLSDGVLDDGMSILTKPFAPTDLVGRVQTVLS